MSAKKAGHGGSQAKPANWLDKVEMDPAVVKVHKQLERTLADFMTNVGEMCRTYDAKLRAAMPFNPKAKFFVDDEMTPGSAASPLSSKLSPLVKRASAIDVKAPSSPKFDSAVGKKTKGSAGKLSLVSPATEEGAATTAAAVDDDDDDDIEEITQANPELVKQLRILKLEARALSKTMDQIHDWIALNIPEVSGSDGDENPALEVMAMVLENVESITEMLSEVYGLEASYLSDRAEAELSALRHPESESTVARVVIIDNNMWDAVERGYRVMIRSSLLLHSTLAKNMKVLKAPSVVKAVSQMHI